MKYFLPLILILLLTGCTSCSLTVATYGEVHHTDLELLEVTVGVRCGTILSGSVFFEIFENKTNSTVLNGSIPFSGATGMPDEYTYFNLSINVSSIQLNPYWYYRIKLYFPGDIYISQSFYADMPMPEDKCDLLPVVGNCMGSYTAYFFNQSSQRCENFTVSGCGMKPYESFNMCQGFCGVRECNSFNPCPEGVDCYEFEDYGNPICWEGDPCNNCFSAMCELSDSEPPEVICQ